MSKEQEMEWEENYKNKARISIELKWWRIARAATDVEIPADIEQRKGKLHK